MKNNKKRKYGFTLLEVIISMAIISIISVSIYTTYLVIIDQTKRGEIKQAAALEGKKVIETLQSNNFQITNNTFIMDSKVFNKNGFQFIRYLNNEYKDKQNNGDPVIESTAKYIESITLTPTKVRNSINNNVDKLELKNNDFNSNDNTIYINKNKTGYYIQYSGSDDEEKIPLIHDNETKKDRIELYIYLPNNPTIEYTEVLDYQGEKLLDFIKDIDENLTINFDNYKEENGTLPIDTDICIYIYNKTSDASNVYLERRKDLSIDLEISKGKVNIYNKYININENYGILYDFKVEIFDKDKKDILFTGYYKKNIH